MATNEVLKVLSADNFDNPLDIDANWMTDNVLMQSASFSMSELHNCSTELNESIVVTENLENSQQFNDTFEEIDYLIKKGIETLNSGKTNQLTVKNDGTVAILESLKDKPNTATLGKTCASKFLNIISPVKTYISSTVTTPLMVTIKSKNKNTNTDLVNTNLFQNETKKPTLDPKQFQKRLTTDENADTILSMFDVPLNLPRIHYSEAIYKQITDQRSSLTIPGGKKIQKYLESTILPAVICHVGRTHQKTSADFDCKKIDSSKKSKSKKFKRCNSSPVESTLNSSETSIYILKDAQKF